MTSYRSVNDIRNAVYADLIEKGYTFRINSTPGDVKRKTRSLETEGLEVCVHNLAFWQSGRLDRESVAILVREIKKVPKS